VPVSPLPQRHGLDAARYRLPDGDRWPTVRQHLYERLTRVDNSRIDEMFAAGRYVDSDGTPLAADCPYSVGQLIWFHRDLPDEVPVPFDIAVLYRDDRIVVVDKPHFLATIPRGQHIVHTALVRLRNELGLPDLAPAHRLDRSTAGVLMFTTERQWRGRYQNLFRDRRARKAYLAVAPALDPAGFPAVVRSHIVKTRGVLRAQELELPPNSESNIELIGTAGELGLYRLVPHTGRTHQLRLHMAGLGAPIVNDPFYPDLREVDRGDFSAPLQLLAAELAFEDPVDGQPRRFVSRRRLAAWPGKWPQP
jgi:tRNA pseudouridine32 synthase/23S rRNA pseudouridine746 synthase